MKKTKPALVDSFSSTVRALGRPVGVGGGDAPWRSARAARPPTRVAANQRANCADRVGGQVASRRGPRPRVLLAHRGRVVTRAATGHVAGLRDVTDAPDCPDGTVARYAVCCAKHGVPSPRSPQRIALGDHGVPAADDVARSTWRSTRPATVTRPCKRRITEPCRRTAHRSAGTAGSADARITRSRQMSDFKPGLEGVVAFETEIAEPDKEGGALRYRGVDIEDLVGQVSFGNVWGLLVDGAFDPGLPPAEPFPIPVHSGDIRVDVQSARRHARARAGASSQLLDIADEQARDDLARVAVMALSFVAQSARGLGLPMVPQTRGRQGATRSSSGS